MGWSLKPCRYTQIPLLQQQEVRRAQTELPYANEIELWYIVSIQFCYIIRQDNWADDDT